MSTDDVNARREYDNSGREEQAALTRRRILDAAHRVVVRNGYVATTMVAIAKEARVSRETVYKAFRSKPELIKQVYDVALVGDEEPIPLRDRAAYRAMVEDPGADGKLRRYAAIVREIYHRLGPLLGVLLIAARAVAGRRAGRSRCSERTTRRDRREGRFGAAESHSRRSRGA